MSGQQENSNGTYEQLQAVNTEHGKTQEDARKVTGRRQAKRNRNRLIAALGLMVVLATAIALMVPAISMTRDTLICGMEAHAHSDACYEMVLTCGQEESEAHEHTQACYERQLVCGLPEHEHTADCYENGDGSLPGEAVADSDAADQASKAAVEGATATAEGAVSGEAATASEDGQTSDSADATSDAAADASGDGAEAEEAGSSAAATASASPVGSVAGIDIQAEDPMPAQSFTADLKDADDNVVMTVAVEAPEGAFPKGTFMKIDGIPAQNVQKHVEEAIQNDASIKGNQKIQQLTAVDICFFDAQGNAIEPAEKVEVKITSEAVRSYQNPVLVHVTQKDAAKKVDADKLNEQARQEAEELQQAAVQAAEDAVAKAQADNADSEDPEAAQAAVDKAAQEAAEQVVAEAAKAAEEAAANNDDAIAAANAASEAKAKAGEKAYKEADVVKKVEVVNQSEDDMTRGNENTMKFKTDKFSPYVIVELKEITADIITANGESYTITASYDELAGIPVGAELSVREVLQGTDEFEGYLSDSAAELGVENDDVSFARFFDIEIVDTNGDKIEPDAPVGITIAYNDPVDTNEFLSIVHFANEGTEVISDVSISEDGKEISYEQSSFSVTGTIQTGNPTNGGIYMVLVEYNGKHYMVNNDGTLSEIAYGEDAAGNHDDSKVAVEYPMFWTYYYQYGGHLRFASEASGFGADMLASGYYYKYIDPNSDSGIIEEHKDDNADNLLGNTVINYHNNSIANAGYNKYIGVVDEGGVLRLVGNVDASHAARIELATPASVLPPDPLKHSVNHIDIAIGGTAEVTVPLAYGTYTYIDGNGQVQTINVSQGNTRDVVLRVDDIEVTSDDMKSAVIKAYKQSDYNAHKDNPEELANYELDDAFYITGYSANDTSQYSEVQVRVEGSFKVAYGLQDANSRYYNWWDYGYINPIKQARLSHQIEYAVTLNKVITLPVTIDGHQLYDGDGTPMKVTVTVPLHDSFSYWDTRNECPPVQWDWYNWQSGDIAVHGLSGMDFRLDGGHVDVKADIVGINITKYIEDMDGNLIKVGSDITNSFDIFRDGDGDPDSVMQKGAEEVNYNDYAFLHSKSVAIPSGSAQNIVHDYEVTPGMYYVRESPQSVADNAHIRDMDGQEWKYKETEILTEYVWRGGADIGTDEKGRLTETHTSGRYTGKESDSYNSIPDVLGRYTVNGSTTAEDNNGQSWDLFNGFLEFYVINKYEKVQDTPEPPTEDQMSIQLDKKWDDDGNTDEPEGDASVPFTLHQVKKTTTTSASGGQSEGTLVVLYGQNNVILAKCYAKPSDTIYLDFSTQPGQSYKQANVEIKSSRYDTNGKWEPLSNSLGNQGDNYIQSNNDGQRVATIKYRVDQNDILDGQVSMRIKPDGSDTISGTFTNPPTWVGATGSSGGSTTVTEEVDADGSGFPKTVTLSNTEGWSHLFADLPTWYEDASTHTTIEYSYYLVEGTPTGSAADYTKQEYKVYLNEELTTEDEKDASSQANAITGRGVTKYIEVTNKKSALVVAKQWVGEAETDAYPPIKFKLYQGVKNGNGVNAGEEYTAETNLEKTADGCYEISPDNDWQVEFYNLPETKDVNGTPTEVGYYVEEVDPNDGSNWHAHVTVRYESSTGNAGAAPQAGGVADNHGQITIINKLPTAAQITLVKKWFENNAGSWSDVSGDENKTSDYAFGFVVQRRVTVLDEQEHPTTEIIDYENYGDEIVVSRSKVLVNTNEFNVESQGSPWQYVVKGNDDLNQHEYALPKTGYYKKEDGTKAWAEFSYRFMETNAYNLASIVDGETIKPESEWQTLPWNPKYENSENQTTISNYPIGEIDVAKSWVSNDPDQEIGNKIYFRVFRDGTDITSDIVANPAHYGLYSSQVHSDGDSNHDSVVCAYNGSAWETVRVQGLQILSEGAAQYQYTIKEIGYSDKGSKDYWDVSKFLKGYTVDTNTMVKPGDSSESPSVPSASPYKTITINNEYVKTETDFEFTKVWQNGLEDGIGWQKPITVTLHQKKGTYGEVLNGRGTNTERTAQITLDPFPVADEPEEGGEIVAPQINRTFTFDLKKYEWDLRVSHEGSYYTFVLKGLPYRDGEDYLSYYVTEESLGDEFTTVYKRENGTSSELVAKAGSDQTAQNGEYIFNIQKLGSLKIKKSVTENGNDELSDIAKATMAGTYTFTLYKDGECKKPYQVIPAGSEEPVDQTVTLTIDSDGVEATSEEVTDLPAGDYWIKETDPGNGSAPVQNPVRITVQPGKTGEKAVLAKFTNDYKSVEITVVKIDETTRGADEPTKVPEATFRLYRLTKTSEEVTGTYTVYPDSNSCDKTTDENGTLRFAGLPDGSYMMEETVTPAGFIKQDEVKVYFTVSGNNSSDGAVVTWTDASGNVTEAQDLVEYAADNKAFTVGNIPGEALPNTGGPGTALLTALGSALALGGVGILLRRRKHQQ